MTPDDTIEVWERDRDGTDTVIVMPWEDPPKEHSRRFYTGNKLVDFVGVWNLHVNRYSVIVQRTKERLARFGDEAPSAIRGLRQISASIDSVIEIGTHEAPRCQLS